MSTYKQFKNEVHALLLKEEGTINANKDMWIKLVAYTTATVGLYLLILSGALTGAGQIALLTAFSFMLMIFMVNVLHDVMHGSFSKNSFFKDYFCYAADIFGASSIVWKNKHNNSHHYYTNNAFVDNDLNVSAILRFTDAHKQYSFNRFQHLYILPAYALHTFFWFFISDYKNIIRMKITTHKLMGFNTKEKFFFFLNKALHIVFAIVIPSMIFGMKSALLGYLYVYSIAGLFLALIFQVAHVYEGSKTHDVEKFESIDHWAKVQIESSTIFAPKSKVAYWFYGGLNYQVTHHLFPEISHTHYDCLYPLVKEYCANNGIQYPEFPSFAAAIKSHLKQIYLLGQPRTEFVEERSSINGLSAS